MKGACGLSYKSLFVACFIREVERGGGLGEVEDEDEGGGGGSWGWVY